MDVKAVLLAVTLTPVLIATLFFLPIVLIIVSTIVGGGLLYLIIKDYRKHIKEAED